jgi:hypothetical protein
MSVTAPSISTTTEREREPIAWLFSPAVDLCAFLGSALLALGLLAVGYFAGWLQGDTPDFLWVTAILMIDVAHVYATGFRVYFDRAELRRRPWLYGLAPALAFAVGAALYSESNVWFWRVLAYLAVFHFVRQQYGWVALYRAKAGERSRYGLWIDRLAIYLSTIYPLVYWHSHLPRHFWWFLEGDFAALPSVVEAVLRPVYWSALALYFGKSLYQGLVQQHFNPGKDVVLATTALCWHLGIITFNSDYAFTVTNVIIHGIPYMILVYWYRWERVDSRQEKRESQTTRSRLRHIATFLGIVWMLAYCEELLWDTGVWHDRAWLFGSLWNLDQWSLVLVPLLAVPQITHYILDGFIWRRRANKNFASMVRSDN